MGNNRLVSICLLFGMLTCSASLAAPVKSTFDTNMDGWTAPAEPGETWWEPTGGNPGGYARFEDGSTSGCDLVAPGKFLGDWSGYDTLEYDHKLFETGPLGYFIPYTVYLSSLNSHARWTGQTPSGQTNWVHVIVPLEESQWVVDLGTWDELLGNVTKLAVQIEAVNNNPNGAVGEVCGIDNVIVPEPGMLSLLALAGLAMLRRKLLPEGRR